MNKNQKIFDILPPEKNQYKISKITPITPKKEREKGQKKAGSPSFLKILFFLGLLLLVFVLVSQSILNKTQVQLWLKTEIYNSEEKLTVNTSETSVDVLGQIIPGGFFEQEVVVSQDFTATGKTTEGGKAGGIVSIYNNYSDSPQTLIAGTRLISASGKLFRTTQKVVVPGGVYEKGKLQPSHIDVSISADEPGESYNIGPTSFSIAGFVGTPKFTAFYGKSFEDMKGGFLGEATQISQDDLEKAKEDLISRAEKEGEELLKSKVPSDFLLPQSMISSEIIDSTSSLPQGAKAENFNYQVKLKIITIGFKKSDLEKFANEFILLKYETEKKIQQGSLKADWKEYSIEQKNGKLVLDIDLSAKTYVGVDENQLKEALSGKLLSEVQQIISARPEISKVQIKSWPFWAKRVVEDTSKIKIELILD